MKKIAFTCVLLLLLSMSSFSQSNKLDKKLEKAIELANNNKLTDAEEYLEKLLKKNPEYGDGWDLLAKIRYKQYKNAKAFDNIFGGNVTVVTKDKDGKEVKTENDSLTKDLSELLNNIKPSKKAYNKYIYSLRKGLLFSVDATNSSFTLRQNFIDPEVDTAVSKKALKYFEDAEEEFSKKNYEKAAAQYKRAIAEQPDFYKASLYLGDSYYFSGNYVYAINYFKEAVDKFPKLLEPRKYLVDAYAKEKLYKNCLDEAINSMWVYPDLAMMVKLDDAAYFNGKKVDIKWTPRAVFPNHIDDPNAKADLNEYVDPDEMEAKGNWVFYKNACDKIKEYCDIKGMIVKPNSLTQSKYLEVYSWEEMLKNSTDPSLEEARRMQKEGYLDCYVLITCFHYDFYDQYNDFVSNNKAKVIAYYNKFIVSQ